MKLRARDVSFTGLMAALGNTLGALSIGLTKVGQVGLDFSLMPCFVAAFYGGTLMGFLVGFLSGIVPGLYFGPLSGWGGLGSLLYVLGLPAGKSLVGATAGLLYNIGKVRGRSFPSLTVSFLTVLSFVPECLFIVVFFKALLPLFIGPAPWITDIFILSIVVKGWIEVTVMAALMGALTGNKGFNEFVSSILKVKVEFS